MQYAKNSDGKSQLLTASIEQDFINYDYVLLDVTFDGAKDLIVLERNGKNSLSTVYEYNENSQQFSNDVYFRSTAVRDKPERPIPLLGESDR